VKNFDKDLLRDCALQEVQFVNKNGTNISVIDVGSLFAP
jgi:hypothetical protein